jgi:hypothetical protein
MIRGRAFVLQKTNSICFLVLELSLYFENRIIFISILDVGSASRRVDRKNNTSILNPV